MARMPPQNDTTRYMRFEHGQWYRIRLRVTAARLHAWIDDQLVVDQPDSGTSHQYAE